MGSLFNLDNPIWRFMGKLVDVFILTLLWAVCCIPIITIGPASTAVYYVTLKLVRDEESYTVRSFFKSFKENFKQGSVIGIIMTLLLVFFLYDIYAYFMMGTQISRILGIVFLGIFLLYLITLVYVYPLHTQKCTVHRCKAYLPQPGNDYYCNSCYRGMSVLPTVDLIKLWSDCIFTVILLGSNLR